MTEAHATNADPKLDRLALSASLPFILFHGLVLLAFVTGVTWEYVLLAVASYYVRMFGVTAGYHRYFAHRAFKTSRVMAFLLAWLAQSTAQKGVLWWAAHHRHHHRTSDQPDDIHSPVRRGFWWSHMGWFLAKRYDATRFEAVKDLARFPELVWLNKYHLVPFFSLVPVAWYFGGLAGVVWGFIIPSVAIWHGTFTINSLSHVFGSRRYLTTDTSRNNLLLALITCGEGWHNNHHYHQNTANQGWFWWEVDFTFYALKVLSWLGLVSDLRLPRQETKFAHLAYSDEQRRKLRAQSRFGNPEPIPAPQTPAEMPALTPQHATSR